MEKNTGDTLVKPLISANKRICARLAKGGRSVTRLKDEEVIEQITQKYA